MDLLTLFTLAVGLSMDAFAVSICKGPGHEAHHLGQGGRRGPVVRRLSGGNAFLGYLLGVQFRDRITAIDHWIAFVLLGIIAST